MLALLMAIERISFCQHYDVETSGDYEIMSSGDYGAKA